MLLQPPGGPAAAVIVKCMPPAKRTRFADPLGTARADLTLLLNRWVEGRETATSLEQ